MKIRKNKYANRQNITCMFHKDQVTMAKYQLMWVIAVLMFLLSLCASCISEGRVHQSKRYTGCDWMRDHYVGYKQTISYFVGQWFSFITIHSVCFKDTKGAVFLHWPLLFYIILRDCHIIHQIHYIYYGMACSLLQTYHQVSCQLFA